AFDPDAVLLDIGLPGLNGYEVARRIRANGKLKDVALIALTGWAQAEDRRVSHEAGFDHHIAKPVDLEALRQLLASLEPRRPQIASGWQPSPPDSFKASVIPRLSVHDKRRFPLRSAVEVKNLHDSTSRR